MFHQIPAGIIEDIASDLNVSPTFCYVIVGILALTFAFAIMAWISGIRRRKKERYDSKKKICPACEEENKPDALLCEYCDEMLKI